MVCSWDSDVEVACSNSVPGGGSSGSVGDSGESVVAFCGQEGNYSGSVRDSGGLVAVVGRQEPLAGQLGALADQYETLVGR